MNIRRRQWPSIQAHVHKPRLGDLIYPIDAWRGDGLVIDFVDEVLPPSTSTSRLSPMPMTRSAYSWSTVRFNKSSRSWTPGRGAGLSSNTSSGLRLIDVTVQHML